jgi:AraC-like DNA-binding protein
VAQGIANQGNIFQGINVWRAPGFDGLLFYRGTNVTHTYPRHWHEELHLGAYGAGRGNLGIRGCSYRVATGDFVITPAGEVHENWVDTEEGCSFRSLYIDIKLLRRLAHQITGRDLAAPDFAGFKVNHLSTHQSFLRMHAVMESPDSRLECDESRLDFVRHLIIGCSAARPAEIHTGSERAAVRRIRAFIDEHFADPISLDDLARIANLSPFHLHRVFTTETGIPPHAYQTQVRINRAKQWMREQVPLSHIAAAAGFADQSHLNRHFRRLVGLTPGRFVS